MANSRLVLYQHYGLTIYQQQVSLNYIVISQQQTTKP